MRDRTTKRRVCVFCGAQAGDRSVYAETATRFGQALVRAGYGLVYGGGGVGLMGVIADAVLAAGGEVLGVLPRSLAYKEFAHVAINELRLVSSLYERKQVMLSMSDAFVALPGGYGTLDELFEVVTLWQLGASDKPVAILNTDGYFDALLGFFDHAKREGFVSEASAVPIIVESDPDDLIRELERPRPRGKRPRWIREDEP